MLEIEAKVKVKNLDTIARKLRRMGAQFLRTVQEQDLYFNSLDGKLLKTNCGLRLRKRKLHRSSLKAHFFLTYKGPTGKSAFKSRREIQVRIDNYDAIKNILVKLGYKKHLTVNKMRHIWQFGKCEICLDKVQGLGTFIEVEGPNEKLISTALCKLGFDKKQHISSGYARMLDSKKHKNIPF
jgi:adenylate cyclase class 2